MTAENEGSVPSDTETAKSEAPASLPAEPTLNRAERRAQAKGKKGPVGGVNPASSQFNNFRGGQGGGGNVGKSRLPRTGHK